MGMLKTFFYEDDGMGTIELVMIIAALMCIALLFRAQIVSFVEGIIRTVFDSSLVEKPN